MSDSSDAELLQQFARNNSEAAFAELVERHIGLVYSTAFRKTGNPQQSEDITQAVFILLARKANSLGSKTVLPGWLHQTARFTAANLQRAELRRVRREQEAFMQSTLNETAPDALWQELSPLLDDAVAALGASDRDAIVLRFFRNRSMAEVGATLGASEGATRMRVNRALEKMRKFFVRRGVAISSAAIAGTISANSVQAAPAGLAAIISANAVSGTTVTTAAVAAAMKAIAMTTFQKAIVTAALVVTVSAGVFEAHQNSDAQKQIQNLQQQQKALNEQVAQLQRERDEGTNQLDELLAENAQLKSNLNEKELLKLRGEVTQLRTANAQNDSSDPTDQAAKGVAAKVKQMKQWLEQNPNGKIPELQYLTEQDWLRAANYWGDLKTDDDFDRVLSQLRRDAKRTFANSIGKALANYVAGNNGQLPGDISQLESYFNPPIDGTMLQRYQVLQTGNLSDIPNNEPLIAEKAPIDDKYDTLFKISATGFSYQGTGTAWVNGSGKGDFEPNTKAKIKPFERQMN